MGLLVGLPLKLFHILFIILRLTWPFLLALVLYFLFRKHLQGGRHIFRRPTDDSGPVVDVNYRVVEDEETGDKEG